MSQPTTTRHKTRPDVPYHVCHESFVTPSAESAYGPNQTGIEDFAATHMPDDVTRDFAKRMHYAAWRASRSRDEKGRQHWHRIYLRFRDLIVVGNRKLIFRAVRRWSPPTALADDMIGDCQIVLIQAVAAYNPWMGIRFSTYAFTCLMRALSRISQRQTNDRLARSLPLESLPEGEPRDLDSDELFSGKEVRIDVFLRDDHALLSHREKCVLVRRFCLDNQARGGTLEQVGKELGLSKERVRQVQACALDKLRKALAEEVMAG